MIRDGCEPPGERTTGRHLGRPMTGHGLPAVTWSPYHQNRFGLTIKCDAIVAPGGCIVQTRDQHSHVSSDRPEAAHVARRIPGGTGEKSPPAALVAGRLAGDIPPTPGRSTGPLRDVAWGKGRVRRDRPRAQDSEPRKGYEDAAAGMGRRSSSSPANRSFSLNPGRAGGKARMKFSRPSTRRNT